MRISDWSSDVCSSDLGFVGIPAKEQRHLPRILRSRLLDQTVKIGRRSARGRRRKLRLRAWETMNLLRKNQRKTGHARSEEHTSELQSLMRISYAVYCLKKKKVYPIIHTEPKST